MEISLQVNQPVNYVVQFMKKPQHLPMWTCHRLIIKKEGLGYQEMRANGLLNIKIKAKKFSDSEFKINYTWSKTDYKISIDVSIYEVGKSACRVQFNLLPHNRTKQRGEVLKAELRLLRSLMEVKPYPEIISDLEIINNYHLDNYIHWRDAERTL